MVSINFIQTIFNSLCMAFGGASQISTNIFAQAIWGQHCNGNILLEEVDEALHHIAGLYADRWEMDDVEEHRYYVCLKTQFDEVSFIECARIAQQASEAEAQLHDFLIHGNVPGYDY